MPLRNRQLFMQTDVNSISLYIVTVQKEVLRIETNEVICYDIPSSTIENHEITFHYFTPRLLGPKFLTPQVWNTLKPTVPETTITKYCDLLHDQHYQPQSS